MKNKNLLLFSRLLCCNHLVNLRTFQLGEPNHRACLRVRVLVAVDIILGNHHVALLQLLRLLRLLLTHKLHRKISRSACGLLLNDNSLFFPGLSIAAFSRHQVGHYVHFSDCFHVVCVFVVCVFLFASFASSFYFLEPHGGFLSSFSPNRLHNLNDTRKSPFIQHHLSRCTDIVTA